jgi:hypothetical protein
MRNLVHSDNIGTVGWSCIQGHFNEADLRWVEMMCPEGDWTPCFPPPKGSSKLHYNGKHPASWWCEYMQEFRPPNATAESHHVSMYYNFPLEPHGEVLLIAMYQRYGMELYPHTDGVPRYRYENGELVTTRARR